jgi:hypothetical protein
VSAGALPSAGPGHSGAAPPRRGAPGAGGSLASAGGPAGAAGRPVPLDATASGHKGGRCLCSARSGRRSIRGPTGGCGVGGPTPAPGVPRGQRAGPPGENKGLAGQARPEVPHPGGGPALLPPPRLGPPCLVLPLGLRPPPPTKCVDVRRRVAVKLAGSSFVDSGRAPFARPTSHMLGLAFARARSFGILAPFEARAGPEKRSDMRSSGVHVSAGREVAGSPCRRGRHECAWGWGTQLASGAPTGDGPRRPGQTVASQRPQGAPTRVVGGGQPYCSGPPPAWAPGVSQMHGLFRCLALADARRPCQMPLHPPDASPPLQGLPWAGPSCCATNRCSGCQCERASVGK